MTAKRPPIRKRRLPPEVTSKIIDELGGTSFVATVCGRAPTTISEWRLRGMPSSWVLYLREKFRSHRAMRAPEVRDF